MTDEQTDIERLLETTLALIARADELIALAGVPFGDLPQREGET